MARIRALLRGTGLVLVTLLTGLPPAIVRRVTFGARRPSTWVGTRCCRIWGRLLCSILGIRRHVEGRPRGDVFLVVSNHVSYVDIIVLSSLYPSIFVAKSEIADWPGFGWITRNCGTLFVDRRRVRDVARVGPQMERHLREGTCVTLFPEGRSTGGATVLAFLPSLLEPAARTGVPCFTASLSYETPDSLAPPSHTICWWGGIEFLPHLWRLLQLRRIEVQVRFSDRPVRSARRKELALRLRQELLERFTPMRQLPRPDGTTPPGIAEKPP